jgi:hypothetical protein
MRGGGPPRPIPEAGRARGRVEMESRRDGRAWRAHPAAAGVTLTEPWHRGSGSGRRGHDSRTTTATRCTAFPA